jgi:hypothetical protein
MDAAGNLEILQLYGSNGYMIQDERWDGSAWNEQPAKEVYIGNHGVPYAITANTSSQGNLLVSVSVAYPYLPEGSRTDILSLGKSVELPAVIPTPYAAIIPVGKPIATAVGATPVVQAFATNDLPAAGLNDSPSFLSGHRNLVGFVLLGGILVLIIAMFRPTSTKQNRQKSTPK